jgi:aldose sugar dehydrogenase
MTRSARPLCLAALMPLVLLACGPAPAEQASAPVGGESSVSTSRPFKVTPVGQFAEPWAMTFIPGTPWLLVTEKAGKLKLSREGGKAIDVTGVPTVAYGGQGGFGDIIMAPGADLKARRFPVYLSWAEQGEGEVRGAVIGRGTVSIARDGASARLDGLKVIWRQAPKVSGRGHYGHRMALSPDGKYLFVGSSDRQKMEPAQEKNGELGKILRLNLDGTPAAGNPLTSAGQPASVWSTGHRNILGLAFDREGQLWAQEMGPAHGDEVNLILPGKNYGWPRVSNGSHYDGKEIPDHAPGDGFEAPKAWWNPAISPAGLVYYDAALFPAWKGSLFIGGLSSMALIRVSVDGDMAIKADQWNMDARIREVEVGSDGTLWLLEDGSEGRLLKLTPAG